jgi:hypothetical protein
VPDPVVRWPSVVGAWSAGQPDGEAQAPASNPTYAAHRGVAPGTPALSVQNFLRGINGVEYDEAALKDVADT